LEDREKKPNTNATARALLFPILASLRSHPAPLAHFTQTFLPLIDQLTNLATGPASNPSNEKAWSVLADQCWYTLPAYCSNPPDLSNAFGCELGERLTTEMYANPTLRPPILRALRNVVESQTQVQNWGEENESEKEESKKNLKYLRGQAKNWLAVLFNVFASVQGGEVIGVWAGVAGGSELAGAYRSVLGHLSTSLVVLRSQPKEKERKVRTSLQILDILFVLALYPPVVQKAEGVGAVVRGGVLECERRGSGYEVGASLATGEGPYDQCGSDGAFSGTFRPQEYATSCLFDEGRI